jgi:hypothetical protein
MKKNVIHRKSILLEVKAIRDSGELFKAGNIYCLYKYDFDNSWNYTDDTTKTIYRLFLSHIRNENLFEIIRQC